MRGRLGLVGSFHMVSNCTHAHAIQMKPTNEESIRYCRRPTPEFRQFFFGGFVIDELNLHFFMFATSSIHGSVGIRRI